MILFKRQTLLKIFTSTQLIEIPELDIHFNIKSHRRRTPNEGEFKIYNLSEDKRNFIDDDGKYIEFYAGYETAPLGLIHKGFLDKSSSLLQDDTPDWMTTIRSIDTGDDKQYTKAFVNETFNAGTPVAGIFGAFADLMNMPILVDFVDADVLLSSESYMGPVRDSLDEIARDYGYSWSIQFGTLEVVKSGFPPIKDSTSFVLNPENIIGTPEITNRGIKFKSLIIPTLIPSRLVTIPPGIEYTYKKKLKPKHLKRGIEGTYITDSINYIGEKDKKEYYASVDAWRER